MKFHEYVDHHHTFMYLWIVGALLVLGGLAYSYIDTHPQGVLDGQHEGDVRTLIGAFGNQLNTVSLLSPEAAEDIRKAYGPYATPELVEAWAADPATAPGRLTSSPWPDHIEIASVIMTPPDSYAVEGEIMLVTSSGDAGSVPVSFTVARVADRYLITSYREQRGTSAEALPIPGTVEARTVALGEIVTAFGVSVTPLEVVEDSRCPANANCIQAGTVRVQGTFEDKTGKIDAVFGLGVEMSGVIDGPTAFVTLTEVTPLKSTSTTIDPSDYRFTFKFEYR
ncbi:MAG: hypothetical protein AB199_01665 [Parcubacteria bacterium C7867-004]|nr:MAG: hypothetical protein AB199_01665 [Parcubacteria bacterium C7867-004]